MKALLTRIRTPDGASAWMVEGAHLTIDETLGRPDVKQLECELTLGEPPQPDPEPTEVHNIARPGLATS